MEPTVKTDKYELRLGDCLPIMQQMEAGSVDAVITDPPYFGIVGDDWDNQWKNRREYVEWIVTLAHEWKRILKDNSSIWIFQDDKNAAYVQVALDEIFLLLNNIVWYKTNALPQKNTEYLRSFAPMTERALFYTTQFDPTGWETVKLDVNNFIPLREYFRQYQEALGLSKVEIIEKIGQKADHAFRWGSTQWDLPTPETYAELGKLPTNNGFVRREYEDLRREYEDLRRPFNADNKTLDVIEWPIVNGNDNTDHPTTKPLGLMTRIISVITNPGQTVLDCCMGSGTTLDAALRLGRRAIGIDNNPGYFEIARKRIEQAARQMVMPMESAQSGRSVAAIDQGIGQACFAPTAE